VAGVEKKVNKPLNKVGAVVLASMLMVGLSACAEVTEPDYIGLYYNEGSSDGYTFDHCMQPGKADDAMWNNSVVFLPISLRTFVIDDAEGADLKDILTASTQPQEGQPSGVEVEVSTKTNFYLNTYCDDSGGVAKLFWEKIGRRYRANIPEGWKEMLLKELVPVQKAIIKDEIRKYPADDLVANLLVKGSNTLTMRAQAQQNIADRLAVEFNRIAGGNFFCGPSFNRVKADCPPLELLVIDVDFRDKNIKAARNNKQVAVEQAAADLARAQGAAAALLAEAQGKANAAKALEALYKTPGWIDLQKQQIQANALYQACQAAKECYVVAGSNGNVWTGH
jgi:hypothetical protein